MKKHIHSTVEIEDADERFLRQVVSVLNNSLSELSLREMAQLNQARMAATTRQPVDMARELTMSRGELPPDVTFRLDAIRAEALQRAQAQLRRGKSREASQGPLGRLFIGYGMPVSAFASVCVLVTALAVFNLRDNMREGLDPLPLVVIEDSVLLASEEDIELYENLEFYQWLAENGLQY